VPPRGTPKGGAGARRATMGAGRGAGGLGMGTITDRHGQAVTGGREAVDLYDQALDHVLRFQVAAFDDAAACVEADPTMPLGNVLRAYLGLLATERGEVANAAAALTNVRDAHDVPSLHPREQLHLAALSHWVDGDMLAAGRVLDDVTIAFPHDVLALAIGHQIDFFAGDAVNLRDRVGRVLTAWEPDDDRYGYLLGMHAFGLEECNLYGLSEAAGTRAVELHADDVWAIHAVTHTFEMQGRVPEGLAYLDARRDAWATGNYLNVHNSWHYALFLLEADEVEGALAIYDAAIHHAKSPDLALELLDASALLWRLHLDGKPVGDRWQPLADAWGRILAPGYYPFNDMHAVMAYVAVDDIGAARNVVDALAAVVAAGAVDTGTAMTASVGLPVARAVLAFGEGRYDAVIDELMPVRHRVHEFGGSHAQRDAVARTLLEAALRAGRGELALALAAERLGVRPASSYTWSKRAAAHVMLGDDDASAHAEREATVVREQVRAAVPR
jgi:hypothetical protein